MNYDKFIQPREVGIGDRTYAVSKIPALTAQQIYNVIGKSVSDNGILDSTMLPQETVRKILEYTALHQNGDWVSLDTERVVNDVFAGDFGSLQRLVIEMVKENFDFFVSGKLLDELLPEQEATDSGS